MKNFFLTLLILGCFIIQQSYAVLVNINFQEFAFTAGNIANGSTSYNIINDTTGAELTSDDGGLDDITITYSSTIPAGVNGAEADAEITTAGIRMNHGFTDTFANTYDTETANNPGTLICHTITITFAAHLQVTDLSTDFRSLNSGGITWETTEIVMLDSDGNPFSTPPAYQDYNSATSLEGRPTGTTGIWHGKSKGTVDSTTVGSNEVAAGSNGPDENFTSTSGNSLFDSTDVGLTTTDQVGGFLWTMCLEDVRGQDNVASSFTATMITGLQFDVVTAVPEPSSLLLAFSASLLFLFRRQRG